LEDDQFGCLKLISVLFIADDIVNDYPDEMLSQVLFQRHHRVYDQVV
jgi:hypothetical protein